MLGSRAERRTPSASRSKTQPLLREPAKPDLATSLSGKAVEKIHIGLQRCGTEVRNTLCFPCFLLSAEACCFRFSHLWETYFAGETWEQVAVNNRIFMKSSQFTAFRRQGFVCRLEQWGSVWVQTHNSKYYWNSAVLMGTSVTLQPVLQFNIQSSYSFWNCLWPLGCIIRFFIFVI